MTDTIVAIATPPGAGAIGVLRISGTAVPAMLESLLDRIPEPRVATYARFLDAHGSAIDEGLALYFQAPASFTGEAVLELQAHGGTVVLALLKRRALELGCRSARPGEFSERAYYNGKIDLAQAEAIADLIAAGTEQAARAAERSLRGELSQRVARIQEQLTALRVQVEAAIDFPDEEIDWLSADSTSARLANIFGAFDALARAARQGVLLRDGFRVVIAGRPNAGKSTLLNRLAGAELAIVTDVPGTTRDLLRAEIALDGMPLHLVDTAGLRDTADQVEIEGVRRARAAIADSDAVLYVQDVRHGEPAAADLAELPAGFPVIVVMNKIDLAGNSAHWQSDTRPPRIYLSAEQGDGLDLLRERLRDLAGYAPQEGGALAARQRHLDALARARQHVEQAAEIQTARLGFELFAEELRCAQSALGEITGEFSSEDLLGEIFSTFCIGK